MTHEDTRTNHDMPRARIKSAHAAETHPTHIFDGFQ